jgi:hypothetical protein
MPQRTPHTQNDVQTTHHGYAVITQSLKELRYLADEDLKMKKILKLIFRKQGGTMQTGLIWLSIWTS